MANQYALQDQNARFAAIAHSGTADNSETVRLVATSAGALSVDLVGGDTINVGTINLGTLTRIGNIGTIESGTITTTLALNTGTITTIVAGTQNTLGTVGVVNNLVTGTLAALASGTITGGTLGNLNYGTVTVDPTPVKVGTSFNAVGTTGAAVWGTLVAASGAGTKQYVSGVDIVVTSGTVDVAVTNIGIGGSVGAGILARGQFVPGGGMAKTFNPVIASGANGTLSYWLGGAGTVSITVQYWQGV